jgi:invasion protein IalB
MPAPSAFPAPAACALALAAALLVGGPAFGQSGTLMPGAGLPLGEDVDEDGLGEGYIAGTYGDWTKVCQRMGTPVDPCGLMQLLSDEEGSPLAEITIFPLPPGGEAVAGANILTPLGTVLPQQITLRVDGGTPRRYPFFFCDVGGCYAQVGFTAAMVESFRRGNSATLTIASVLEPDQPIDLNLSLSGFTAGYSALPPAPAN